VNPKAPEAGGLELRDGSFLTRDGLALSTFRLPAKPRGFAPVVLLHGLNDHCRSLPYLRLGRALADQGFEVFAFDRRGSGRSAGLPNYAPSFDDLRDDLGRFVDWVEDQCGRLPSLIGLSLGGLQALDFALHAPESLRGCVALAPALDASGTSWWLRRILPLLARWAPRFEVDPGLDETGLTREEGLRREYREDPLWREWTTPAFSLAALGAIEEVHRRAREITCPLLIFHGTADRVVPIGGTREVFPKFGSMDKTLIELPGAFHALPIEPEGPAMAEQIASWLRARSGG